MAKKIEQVFNAEKLVDRARAISQKFPGVSPCRFLMKLTGDNPMEVRRGQPSPTRLNGWAKSLLKDLIDQQIVQIKKSPILGETIHPGEESP